MSIYVRPDLQPLFSEYKTIADFLNIDVDLVRDFKNRKTGRFEIDGRGFYIKKHFPAGWGAVLDELSHLRWPHIGAIPERKALDRLTELGIPTMQVAAAGVEGVTFAGEQSFLVTDELTEMESLKEITATWRDKPPSVAFKRALLDQVATLARRLHEGGVNHRDFYICHFLMNITGGPSVYTQREPELYLIDLHRAQLRGRVPYRWRVKDLAGLLFSALDIGLTRTDITRFLRIYTSESLGQTLRTDRRLYRAVLARATRTYQRDFGRFPDSINALKF